MHNLDVRKTEKDGFVNIEEGTSSLKKKRGESIRARAHAHTFLEHTKGIRVKKLV